MYIYNVTTNVDASIHQEWLKWMKEEHIPNMLSLGKFTNAKMSQVMVEEEMGGTIDLKTRKWNIPLNDNY